MPVLAANQTGGAQPLKAHLVFAPLPRSIWRKEFFSFSSFCNAQHDCN